MTAPTDPDFAPGFDLDDDALAQALHRSRALEDAPEALIQRAIGVFQPRLPAQPVPGLRQRLSAWLSFDSGAQPGLAGLRAGIGVHDIRQLLYSADGRDIDLRVTPSADGLHWQVSGQVLGPDRAGTAELMAGGLNLRAEWNELAEFRFDGVPAGECSLVLRGADWEVVLPSFQTAEPD